MSMRLFDEPEEQGEQTVDLGLGAVLLKGFAVGEGPSLLASIEDLAKRSPFRHMVTPGGFSMSVAMTNCGPLGWVTDRKGYRYDAIDPETGMPWPAMPESFLELASKAASNAGFKGFRPDACLVNRYGPKTRLTLHQDRNERAFDAPIVSVSLGLPARFLLGGDKRSDETVSIPLVHGDVAVWGGVGRLRYHGVAPLKEGSHPLAGSYRYNLTFRRAG